MTDRTQAFDRLTDDYHRFRPGYPADITEHLREHVLAGGGEPRLLLDVGSGTGISTRTLRHLFGPGPRVVGVEPGRSMRGTAVGEADGLEYVDGRAEALPFPDGAASLVLAAQAVHWFDRPAFYAEAARVLAPGGTAAVLHNDRDWESSDFVDAYEGLLEKHGDDYRRDYRVFDTVGEMNAAEGLADAVGHSTAWTRELDLDGLLGGALSSSKVAAVVRALGEDATRAAVTDLAREHFPDGRIRIPYVTRLFLARRT
ncbi:class I SAM-dependent methyltransferase [Nocardiopsis sp. CC223A]|uniref:class I SAM-dependent methyltransferase n=1 Tax=Nocardiopsis sp. CC223A TaxID=3044051 RepID=UPI00278C340F|nr:class I SAM-dependent methyltransferase [Nocardiopsis sp. CC223A]